MSFSGATPGELGFGIQELPSGRARESSPGSALIAKREWTRDDIGSLSESFDEAISTSALADIEMFAHEWLSADKPQLLELNTDAGSVIHLWLRQSTV